MKQLTVGIFYWTKFFCEISHPCVLALCMRVRAPFLYQILSHDWIASYSMHWVETNVCSTQSLLQVYLASYLFYSSFSIPNAYANHINKHVACHKRIVNYVCQKRMNSSHYLDHCLRFINRKQPYARHFVTNIYSKYCVVVNSVRLNSYNTKWH